MTATDLHDPEGDRFWFPSTSEFKQALTGWNTREELLDALRGFDRTVASLENQIRQAEAQKNFDKEWMARIQYALRMNKTNRMAIQDKIGQLKRKDSSKRRLENKLIEELRKLVPQEVYQQALRRAKGEDDDARE